MERLPVILRLRRIEGQLRGLQRMLENDTPCPEVLTQLAAVSSALRRAGLALLESYAEECFGGGPDALREFRKALSRLVG